MKRRASGNMPLCLALRKRTQEGQEFKTSVNYTDSVSERKKGRKEGRKKGRKEERKEKKEGWANGSVARGIFYTNLMA